MSCIDEETLGAFVEGNLDAQRRREVMEHLESCESCTVAVGLAAESLREETAAAPRRSRAPWWLAAAAVLATALLGVLLSRGRFFGTPMWTPMTRLVAAAPADHRLIEPRLTGGFAYAEYRGPVRDAESSRSDPERLKLQGAAGDVLDRSRRDASPETTHAAGVALLLIDDPSEAIERLRPIAGNDAEVWSDLAAAYYASARPSLYPQALAAADRALAIDERMPEASFNRALVLERMGLLAEARKAWERYLEVDPSSAWADEARARLTRLGTTGSSFQRDLPRLSAEELVARYPQEARTWGEGPFLAEWAEGRAESLGRARAIGDALAKRSGEMLLRDAVAAIDRARDARPLLEGHLADRDGRIAYSRRELAQARRKLERAAEAFARGGSPMALAARYFAANVVYDLNRPGESYEELTRILDATPASYRALRAQILWQRALCSSTLTHWSESVEDGEEARSIFDALGEESNRAFVDVIVSDVLDYSAEIDRAWERRVAAFGVFSRAGADQRLVPALAAATRDAVRRGHDDAARALASIEIEAARRGTDRGQLAVALLYRALLLHRSGGGDPMRDLAEARAIGALTGDAPRVLAEIDFAEGVVLRRRDPRRSIELLSRSAEFFRSSFPVYLPAALLARGRVHRDGRMLDEALSDFTRGIEMIEQRRGARTAGEIESAALFDDEQNLFGGAIEIALQQGEPRAAFAYAERALQHALRSRFATATGGTRVDALHPDEALVAIYATGDGVVLFCATGGRVEIARAGDAASIRGDARALVDRLASKGNVEDVQAYASRLYAALVAPLRASLANARSLIFVADPRLGFIPFPVLFDEAHSRYLIEDFEIVMRPSNALPLHARAALSPTAPALIVANPAIADAPPLPGAEREAREVAASYRDAEILTGESATRRNVLRALEEHRIFHYAGHAASPAGTAGALMLTGGRLYASDIARLDLRNVDFVVLAACRSSRAMHDDVPRDLATAFAVAGAGNVVGTGWEIDDATSTSLFAELHRAVASGVRVAAAVRDIQLGAIRAKRHPSTWGAITLVSTERS